MLLIKKMTVSLFSLLFIPIVPVMAANVAQMQLENGLMVLVKEHHRSPVVTSQVWYKVGASN